MFIWDFKEGGKASKNFQMVSDKLLLLYSNDSSRNKSLSKFTNKKKTGHLQRNATVPRWNLVLNYITRH